MSVPSRVERARELASQVLLFDYERLLARQTLGSGEHATVYLVWNVRLLRLVARKKLADCGAADVAALRREADMQRYAASKGIAPAVLAVDERRCTIDMVPVGRSLKRVCLDDGKLTAAQQRALIALIDGVAESGIVHCDLHAGNILEGAGGAFVAIDFDGARVTPSRVERAADATEAKGRYLFMLLHDADSGLVAKGWLTEPANILQDQVEAWGYANTRTRSRRKGGRGVSAADSPAPRGGRKAGNRTRLQTSPHRPRA